MTPQPQYGFEMWPASPRHADVTDCLAALAAKWPDICATPIWPVALALAEKVEQMGRQAASLGHELPYHNRDHVADVLLALSALFQPAATSLSVTDKALLVTAMLAHDLGHAGRLNSHRYELEWQAWQATAPLLAALPTRMQRAILHIILSTDPASYARLNRELPGKYRHIAQIAVEADLWASIQPERGFYLGAQLGRELASSDPALAARLQSLDGRLRFLRHCPVRSLEACALGLDRLVTAQISLISQMSALERRRAWSPEWGRAYAAQVAAVLNA